MTRRMRIDDLTTLAVPSQPALSPDGTRIVYVLRTLDAEGDRNVDQLWPCRPPAARRAGSPPAPADTAPAWSPDGTRLAFLRDGQVHVLAADGGEPEQVTDLPLGAGAPVWSPDGDAHRLHRPGRHRRRPDRRHRARSSPNGVDYQADGAGMLRAVRSQLHVLDLASGDVPPAHRRRRARRPARPGRPTAARLAFTRKVGARQRPHLPHRRAPARRRRPEGAAAGRRASPTASPARSSFTRRRREPAGRRLPGRPGSATPRLLRVPLDGGEPVDLTGHLDRNVMPGAPGLPRRAARRSTADGRRAVRRPRPRLHPPVRGAVDGGEPRPVLGRRRPRRRPASRSPAAPPRSRSPRPRRSARSSPSTSPPAPRPC